MLLELITRGLIGLFGLWTLLPAAVVLDRLAVIAGTHAIKASDIDRDIRLTDFLNREPLNLKAKAKHEAAERLITQEIIRDEIVTGGFRRPSDSEAVQLKAELRRDRFGDSEQRMREALQRYGLTEDELQEQLLWQITVLRFIDERFRAGVVVTDDDVRNYYDQHIAELRQQYPRNSSLDVLAPKIRASLEGERINQNFNEWLDQARKSLRIEYKQGAPE
jgi:peptidyl-prolyl cis-trans isomerase SurA